MNIEAEKAMIIEQVKKETDIDLITAIKSMLDYARTVDKENYNIPLAHQNLVMERFDKSRDHPEILLDWDEAKGLLNNWWRGTA